MSCSACAADLAGAKFCPACGQLNGGPSGKVSAPAAVKKEDKKKKSAFFEEQIKAAAPKKVEKKTTWAQTKTGGDMYGQGKFKAKTELNLGPPPEKRSITDLP